MAWGGNPNRLPSNNSSGAKGLPSEGTRTEQNGRDVGSECMCPNFYARCSGELSQFIFFLADPDSHPMIFLLLAMTNAIHIYEGEDTKVWGIVQACWALKCSLTLPLSCGALPHTLTALQTRDPFPVKARRLLCAWLLNT